MKKSALLFVVVLLLFMPLSRGAAQDHIIPLDLSNGKLYLFADPSTINWGNLSWVEFQLVPSFGGDQLVGEGFFVSGRL